MYIYIIYSDIVSAILSDTYLDILSDMIWHVSLIASCILSDFLSSDILSRNPAGPGELSTGQQRKDDKKEGEGGGEEEQNLETFVWQVGKHITSMIIFKHVTQTPTHRYIYIYV
jgi:hypothetical protein